MKKKKQKGEREKHNDKRREELKKKKKTINIQQSQPRTTFNPLIKHVIRVVAAPTPAILK
jgi:hypothetical protein